MPQGLDGSSAGSQTNDDKGVTYFVLTGYASLKSGQVQHMFLELVLVSSSVFGQLLTQFKCFWLAFFEQGLSISYI